MPNQSHPSPIDIFIFWLRKYSIKCNATNYTLHSIIKATHIGPKRFRKNFVLSPINRCILIQHARIRIVIWPSTLSISKLFTSRAEQLPRVPRQPKWQPPTVNERIHQMGIRTARIRAAIHNVAQSSVNFPWDVWIFHNRHISHTFLQSEIHTKRHGSM